MTIVTALIQALFFSADGWVGFVMHVLASGALVGAAGLIYRIKKTKPMAVFALLSGIISMTAIMVPANLIFTVNFYGVPYDVVVAGLPVTIAFNLIKSTANALVVFLIYKFISNLLQKEHKLQNSQ